MGQGSGKEQQYLRTIFEGSACATGGPFKSIDGGNEGGYPDEDGDHLGIDTNGPKAASSVKDSVVREIAYGFADILHTSKPSPKLSPKELVKWMRDNLPNPRDGRTITADAGKQEQLCKSLGNFLMKVYPQANIDSSLSGHGVCSQVAEVVGTMGSGVYSEFIESATGVQRTINNIKTIGEFVRRANSRYMKIAEGADRSVSAEISAVIRLTDEIMKEHDRQLVILSQLTNTIVKPVTRDLVSLLKENEDFAGLVNSLKASMGTSEWGDRISYAMAGVPNLSDMMLKTKDAAQKLNMSVRDIINAPSLKQLKLDIESAKRNMKTDMSQKAVEEMADAEGALKKAYKFRSELKEKTSGGFNVSGGMCPIGGRQVAGGAQSASGGLPSVDRRLKTQTLTRKTMLSSFTEKARILFERMLAAVYNMSKKLGTSIPLSDDLSRFVHTFDQMGNIYKEGIEYALTGYYTHASATEQRERFLGQLTAVLSTLNTLASGQGGEYFRDIKSALEELQKHIDFYIDRFNIHEGPKIQRKFTGATEGGDGVDKPEQSLRDEMTGKLRSALRDPAGAIRNITSTMKDVKSAAADAQSAVRAGDDSGPYDAEPFSGGDSGPYDAEPFSGGDSGPYDADPSTTGGGTISRAALTLQNAQRTLKHFYAVAKMRANLFKVSSESKKYNEKYETVLGDSLSKCIDKVKKDYNDFKSIIDDKDSDRYYPYMKLGKVYNSISLAINSGNTALREWDRSVILKFKKNEVNAKIELYRALQAIDMTLMHFSDSVAANPDDIKEVAKMLDSIEIVSEWFNERSGDSIAGLFEYMPFMMRRFEAVDSPLKTSNSDTIINERTSRMLPIRDHYYQHVDNIALHRDGGNTYDGLTLFDSNNMNGLPGNPFIVISPQRALYAQEFAKKTVERILALKNIVSAFAYLGNKFGGETLASKVFMSPAQIYKALVTYLHTSAFTMGWDGYNDIGDGDGPQHHAFALPYPCGNAPGAAAAAAAVGINGYIDNNNSSIGGSTDNVLVGVNSFASGTNWNVAADINYASADVNWTDGKFNAGGGGGAAINIAAVPTSSWRNAVSNGLHAGPAVRWPYMVHTATDVDNKMPDAPPFVKCAFGCAMNSVKSVDQTTVKTVGGWHNSYEETDELFIIGIKAMVAKVFTASGLYNMFNYKSRDDHTMSSARFVIGGNAKGGIDTPSNSLGLSSAVEVYDDAIELYIRLPLLVEFYRDVFSLDNTMQYTPDGVVVALIPEMDSMWTGIMRHAFESAVDSGSVITKNYAARMISEVNNIYNRYKNKGTVNLVSTVVTDFIADVNSRFGIMKRNEVAQYKSNEGARRAEMNMNDSTEIRDFDTLDEDEETGFAGIAPSDKFGKIPYGESLEENEFKNSFIRAIADFREKIDIKIKNAVYGNDGQAELGHRIHAIPNFHDQVRMTKDSLKTATTPEQRFSQIFATMSGLDSSVKRAEESYLMFHETIVAPLAVLSGILSTMMQLETTIWFNCIGTGFEVLCNALKPTGQADAGMRHSIWPGPIGAAPVTGNVIAALAGFSDLLEAKLPENIRRRNNIGRQIQAAIIRPQTYHFEAGVAGLPYTRGHWGELAQQMSEPVAPSGITPENDTCYRSVVMIALWTEKCFKHLMQAIISHTSVLGGMVDVNANERKLVLDHSKLQQYCEDTLGFVRRSIHKFRGVIDSAVINRYEGNGNKGSIESIQRSLIDDMFNGNNGGGLPKALIELNKSFMVFTNNNPIVSGQRCFTRNLNLMSRVGNRPVTVLLHNVNQVNPLRADHADHGIGVEDQAFNGLSLDDVLSELVYYNPLTMSNINGRSGSHRGSDPDRASRNLSGDGTSFMNPDVPDNIPHVLTRYDALEHVIKSSAADAQNRGGRGYTHANFMGRWNIYLGNTRNNGNFLDGFRGDRNTRRAAVFNNDTNVTANVTATRSDGCEGLMIRFNEVLAAYLENFWDQSSTKIYQPVIADFANGVANNAVMKAQGWPDLYVPQLLPTTNANLVLLSSTTGGVQGDDAAHFRNDQPDLQQYVRHIGNFINFDVIDDGQPATWVQPPPPPGGAAVDDYTVNPKWFINLKWAYVLGALLKSYTPNAAYAIQRADLPFGKIWAKASNNNNPLAVLVSQRGGFANPVTQSAYIRGGIANLQVAELPTQAWLDACNAVSDQRAQNYAALVTAAAAGGGAIMPAGAAAGAAPATHAAFAAAIAAFDMLVPARAVARAAGGVAGWVPPAAGNAIDAEARWYAAEMYNAVTYTSVNKHHTWATINNTLINGADAGEAKCDPAHPVRVAEGWNAMFTSVPGAAIVNYEDFVGVVDDAQQFRLYDGADPAHRVDRNGITLNDNTLKVWIMRALLRARNETIKLFNDNPGYTREMINKNIADVFNTVDTREKEWHRTRIENVMWFRYYTSTLSNDAAGTLAALLNDAAWRVQQPSSNPYARPDTPHNAGVITNIINAIMAVVNVYMSSYRTALAAEVNEHGPAGVIAAAIFNVPMASTNLTGIFDVGVAGNEKWTPFSLNPPAPVGAANTRINNTAYIQSQLLLGLKPWQISQACTVGAPGTAAGRWRNFMLPTSGVDTSPTIGATPLNFSIEFSPIFGMGIGDKSGAADNTANLDTQFTAITRAPNAVKMNAWGVAAPLVSVIPCGAEITYDYGAAGAQHDQIGQLYGFGWTARGAAGGAAMLANEVQMSAILTAVDTIFAPFRKILDISTEITNRIEDNITTADSRTVLGIQPEGKWGNPREIVFASLSKALRTMLTEQGRNNTPAFLITNMSEVPLRMKEQFKANLPGFIKMFGMIHSSANVIKKVLRMGISVQRYIVQPQHQIPERNPIIGVSGWVDNRMNTMGTVPLDNETNARTFYTQLLDKITTSCEGITKCATKVLDEIGDNPLFMETHENSISDYRNSTNVSPYMPPSTALLGLQSLEPRGTHNAVRDPRALMPVHNPSSKSFEFNYGTRLVLNRPNVQALLDHFPGMREITEQYNKTTVPDKQFALETVNEFLGKYIALLRWISDVRVFSPFANGFAPIGDEPLFAQDINDNAAPINFNNRPIVAKLNMDAAIGLTTNSDKNGSRATVSSHIGGVDAAGQHPLTRSDVQVYNIIDMNVNPININALRREVPLINMLNYAYTFNSFARDLIGNFRIANPDTFTGSRNHLQNFLELVLAPYIRADFGDVHHQHIINLYGSLPGVNSNMGGHDRFAVDQILGKALFANVVDGIATEREGNQRVARRHGRSLRASRNATRRNAGGAPAPTNSLFYLRTDTESGVRQSEEVLNDAHQARYVKILGGMRFDTTFIRNILFISSAHRLMRTKMSDELMKISFPVVSGPAVTNTRITDGAPWETWDELRTD